MDKKKTEKEIEYWSKHQELDKFNVSNDTALYVGYVVMTISIFIILSEFIQIIFSNKSEILKIILSILIMVLSFFIILFSTDWRLRFNRHNKHFISRELMLRYWYTNYLDVNTNELDSKNKKIMKLFSCYGRNVPKELVDAIMGRKIRKISNSKKKSSRSSTR